MSLRGSLSAKCVGERLQSRWRTQRLTKCQIPVLNRRSAAGASVVIRSGKRAGDGLDGMSRWIGPGIVVTIDGRMDQIRGFSTAIRVIAVDDEVVRIRHCEDRKSTRLNS